MSFGKAKVIHLCVNCGSYCGGKYCNYCSTAEKRQKMVEQNEIINNENIAKGFKVQKQELKYVDNE